MTNEEFLTDAGWRRGESLELISGGDWYDPLTGEHYWSTHEAVRIQTQREGDRLAFVLARCEVTLSVPDGPIREDGTYQVARIYAGTLTIKVKGD